ncbi:acetyltransferase [Streptomyces sp. NBC_00285]|uniref:GNAT family N-acetyltransferase n=1 Tax=Streptomyces sp. NBC_00285 TaxID=2975700 RepID=UPI002E2B50D4|nr:GNAT family N-acetyltransferase [Streptomyces sp. NBC_00285]
MSPTDARADAHSTPFADVGIRTGTSPDRTADSQARGTGRGSYNEDTLDLRLPEDLLALVKTDGPGPGPGSGGSGFQSWGVGTAPPGSLDPTDGDLLDGIVDWGPITTPAGAFQLVPVTVERDVPLVCRWMNDPVVTRFWELAGPQHVTENHLRPQLAGDGRSMPCLGVLEGNPMSYWEIYRADLDPLARHYPARPHDTGIHLLIGTGTDRGRGLGSTLVKAVADLVLDKRPACARVVAEPDLRNILSIAAFLSAGFRLSAEVDLPDKRAALLVRDRSLRDLI